MSGGRATIRKKSSIKTKSQAGDISAIADEGHALLSVFVIECKHYRDLNLLSSLLNGKGKLAQFWSAAQYDAGRHDRKPLLIAKQNNVHPFALLRPQHAFKYFGVHQHKEILRSHMLESPGVAMFYLKDLLAQEYDESVF